MKIVITKQAEKDLETLYEYGYTTYGEHKADIYYDKILATFDLIKENPEIVPLPQELSPAVRIITVMSHIIIYRHDLEAVEIIAVPHGSSDWMKLSS